MKLTTTLTFIYPERSLYTREDPVQVVHIIHVF